MNPFNDLYRPKGEANFFTLEISRQLTNAPSELINALFGSTDAKNGV